MKKKVARSSLGIALTEHTVEAALLRPGKNGLALVRSGRIELPKGVIEGGRILQPRTLGAIIRRLLRREGIPAGEAVVGFPDRAVLTQILEIPQNLPSNLHQYIRSEIRHSPLLSGRQPVYDFLRLGGNQEVHRVLVGAADRERLEELLQALHAAGLRAGAVETDAAAVLRALQKGVLAKSAGRCLLTASITGGALTVCVFIREQLDFIRRISLSDDARDRQQQVLGELGTIRQFYEIEREILFDADWQCVLISDDAAFEAPCWKTPLEQILGTEVTCAGGGQLIEVLGVGAESKCRPVGACAVGLAMRPFEPGRYMGEMDFLPENIRQWYGLKRRLTASVATCAAVLAGMFLLMLLSQLRIERLASAKASARPAALDSAATAMEQKRRMEHELHLYSGEVKRLEKIIEAAPNLKWSVLLSELRGQTPEGLWLFSIQADPDGRMVLRGQALSHAAVYRFADRLEQSPWIEDAHVGEIRGGGDASAPLEYQVNCRIDHVQRGAGDE
jgi:Tfp pilus assembly protein PilN